MADVKAPPAEDWDDYVDPFRAAGFSYKAVDFPRCELGLAAFAAWAGVPVESFPVAWRFYPNANTKAAWERVIAAVRAHP